MEKTLYLVFDTKDEAESALKTIYSNMVDAINSPDLLNVDTGQTVSKDDLSPDQAVQIDADDRHFPIFGINAATGQKNSSDGYTTAWAESKETTDGKWVFQKPDDSIMAGVTGYIVQPYDPTWFPQDVAG